MSTDEKLDLTPEKMEELKEYVRSGLEDGWTLSSFERYDRWLIGQLLDHIEENQKEV